MPLTIRPASSEALSPWRELYRSQANVQIIHDSAIGRRLADAYSIHENDQCLGYGAVWNKYYPGRLMEFYLSPQHESRATALARELIAVAKATHLEAQTNMPLMSRLLQELATDIFCEAILFKDDHTTSLAVPQQATFRARLPGDDSKIFDHHREPVGDYVIEHAGQIVATGGYLCHYNPPYGDIYMEVHEPYRRRGIGSYLIGELKRVARENGKTPAARCNPDNIASRKAMERAGLSVCGEMLAGKVRVGTIEQSGQRPIG